MPAFRRIVSTIGGLSMVVVLLTGGYDPERVLVNRDRWFALPFGRVWDAVTALLAEEGFEVTKRDRGKGELRTGWYEFPIGRFGPSVALDTPSLTLTWDYGIYHQNRLSHGRCYLKLSVRPSGEGTRVAVAAEINEWTFHRDLRKLLWARRESNGAIEVFLLDRLEQVLGAGPAGGEADGGGDVPVEAGGRPPGEESE